MSLLDRVTANRPCRYPDCKRAPAYPDQAFCDAHRVKWEPEWRKRAKAKDTTDWSPAL